MLLRSGCLSLLIAHSLLGACSTIGTPAYQAYPLEDGTVEIEASDGDEKTAARFATRGAEHYCGKKRQTAVYLKRPDPEYQGSLTEALASGVRTAERVVRDLGGDSSGASPGEDESDADYKATYTIRCQ